MSQAINITKGNDHRLRVAMTRWSEPMALSSSSNVHAYAVKSVTGVRYALVVRYSAQDEGVMEVDWPSTLTAGCYGLEITGTLEGEGQWRMAAANAVKVTQVTEKGGESITMTGDSFDVVGVVTVCVGSTGVTEELRQAVADMIEEEYNASERLREEGEFVRETHEDNRILAEEAREGNELTRENNETTRQTNETARQQAEAARQGAETQRQEAESQRAGNEESRQQVFETSQTQRQSSYTQAEIARDTAYQTAETARNNAYSTAEGQRDTAFSEKQAERQAAYSTAEAARDAAFTEKQTQRQTSFETAEAGRATTFTANEQQRGTTFATNEQQRQTTFATNEGTKQGSVAGDGSRWGMYKQAESQRDSSYQAAEQQRGTSYQTAEGQRDSDYQAAEQQRGTSYQAAEQQRNTESSAATSAANNAAAAANKAAEDAEDKIEELTAKEATIEDLDELAPAITVADPAIEVIKVILADKTGEQNLQGLPVRLYLWDDENDAWVLSETKTADTYGIAVFSVEYGVLYKITFTQVTGCEVIADVEHRAALIWRAVEATYKLPDAGEILTVVTHSLSGSAYTPLAGVTVSVSYGSVVKSKQTDAQGQAEFTIPTGQQYTVSTTPIDGLYARYNKYSEKHTASQTRRTQTFTYTPCETGFFLIDGQGRQYNIDEWRDAVTAGTVEAADAKLVKISTEALASHGGVFAIDIDMIAYGTGQPANQTWAASNVKFNSIPENGNNTSANYYYDGYTASQLIKQEGAERSIATPAVTAAMAKSVTVGDETLPGFLGSIAQWSTLWQNRAEIDALIEEVRPDHTNSISARTTQKWTSTQYIANNAWYWTSSASNNNKNNSYAVVPFFAY